LPREEREPDDLLGELDDGVAECGLRGERSKRWGEQPGLLTPEQEVYGGS